MDGYHLKFKMKKIKNILRIHTPNGTEGGSITF